MSGQVETELVEGVLLEVEPVSATDEKRPVEAWQTEHQVPGWLHLGACASERWAQGREVTSDEYCAAVEAFSGRPVERE